MTSQLNDETAARIRDLMEQGFLDDEIRDQLLDDVVPGHRGVVRSDLDLAIREVRPRFRRGRRGRPAITKAVHAYRWRRAVEVAGSDALPAVARHYRMQSGEAGLEPGLPADVSARLLESRIRHLQKLRARFPASE